MKNNFSELMKHTAHLKKLDQFQMLLTKGNIHLVVSHHNETTEQQV